MVEAPTEMTWGGGFMTLGATSEEAFRVLEVQVPVNPVLHAYLRNEAVIKNIHSSEGLNFSTVQLEHTHTLTHQGLILMKGMGAQVKKTVMRRNDFLPQMSDSAPIRGADRNDRKPWAEGERESASE